MSSLVNNFWQCYQETEFFSTQALSCQLSFAIITAYNPQGVLLSSMQNRLLDRKLQNEIEALGLPYRAIMGASADKRHMEKSWAITVDRNVAIQMGVKFDQNAIYYVEADHLRLIPCLIQEKEICLGLFSEKVKLVSELPKSPSSNYSTSYYC
ncbi:DUF3293 domain-containing protein [Shewanella surugensis]|uniref:DUF3293 domain-containing protein n=1 Tax=Shewanella surugensis TaxID=212020 RepID=A0ABT0LHX9_9GAMM|nr:DUF3293 domain-containing protein [Shewanella surugensis]MCL1126970.1 DUF3293 domain-containing protein [Shewanella surugensis]